LRGVVTRRDADTFTVQETDNSETVVRLTDTTRVTERKSNPFRRARNYGVTNILRGLNVEIEGRGDAAGQLVADRVRFSESERRVAQTVEARVNPVEDRVSATEQNAQRISGQLDELAAVSNAARGGAKAAQETADAAIAGVTATNERISSLDDYTAQGGVTVNFRVNSSVLSPEAKSQLDQVARQALTIRGYIIEVKGFTDTTGSLDLNRRLSQRRADAVVRHLVENHNIPLRRITTPFGYGEAQAVADNTTSDGRSQNRRVEVNVLVNRGLTQPSPTMNTSSTTSSTTPN
jgi:outer membrane protein OmpA-like peptidoglycan-associated protein